MSRILVLGSGMVGSMIAADLAADREHEVTLADRSEQALSAAIQRAGDHVKTVVADCSDTQGLTELAGQHDAVCGALASHLGYGALGAVIDAGKPYCDISFMPENALDWDAKAKDAGVTAVVDCGVAPGMSNLLAAYGVSQLSPAQKVAIYVGGVPVDRRWPYEYKAGFAPADVLEEYTRTARYRRDGKLVEMPALTEPELLNFAGLGTLEAFNTDGLRTLLETLPDVPDMVEKTMRYPGHAELMRVFADLGLFSTEAIDVNGQSVVPLDFTSRLLFPKWQYESGEADLTIMRIRVEGANGRWVQWDLHDGGEPDRHITSMARTTAYPCAIVMRMILEGRISQAGVCAPEGIAEVPGLVDAVLEAHRMRGVEYRRADSESG